MEVALPLQLVLTNSPPPPPLPLGGWRLQNCGHHSHDRCLLSQPPRSSGTAIITATVTVAQHGAAPAPPGSTALKTRCPRGPGSPRGWFMSRPEEPSGLECISQCCSEPLACSMAPQVTLPGSEALRLGPRASDDTLGESWGSANLL